MATSKRRILIVDDERKLLVILRDSLSSLGADYEVITQQDGFEALRLLRQQPFDLVITDYRMAGLDGIALLAGIRAIRPDTKVILMTAYGTEAIETKTRRLNAYRYLSKPLEIDEFRAIVREAIGDLEVPKRDIMVISDDRYETVMKRLQELSMSVKPRYLVLTDTSGQEIAAVGTDENLHVPTIGSLLSGSIATLTEVGQPLKDPGESLNLAYREGKEYDLYAMNVGQDLLLIIILDTGSSKLGTVWFYAQQTVRQLRADIGEAEHGDAEDLLGPDFSGDLDRELEDLLGES